MNIRKIKIASKPTFSAEKLFKNELSPSDNTREKYSTEKKSKNSIIRFSLGLQRVSFVEGLIFIICLAPTVKKNRRTATLARVFIRG
jgi:hypothetical protein